MRSIPEWARRAQAAWRYRGQERPPFAVVPGPGQESVWDYPRPPRIASDAREVMVRVGAHEIARSRRSVRLQETASPPTFYLPPDDVRTEFLEVETGTSHCEWKGEAHYWSVMVPGHRVNAAAWSYANPLADYERIRGVLDASGVRPGRSGVQPAADGRVRARADVQSEYGVLATPRMSLLARPTDRWIMRVSAGTGAFAPTPFTELTEETGLSRVGPLQGIRAERAIGGSIDVTRIVGPFEVTGTLFGSRVDHPLQSRIDGAEQVMLFNADGPTRSWGTELLARYRSGGFTALATHAWTRSTERDPDGPVRREVPLTPTHTASFNIMWEIEGRGRFGIETYYVGRQALEDNPYRQRGRSHVLLGALLERSVGRARLFLNSENLLDVRQTKIDPLVLPRRMPDGRWTVDAWAPLDGRVINGGGRVGF
jgi:uncharacterized protein (DUF427 family)